MKYEIKGDMLPVVVLNLEKGESIFTERGAMSWMSPNMEMITTSGGGAKKALGRFLSGDSIFQNTYTAKGAPGLIAFASSFPGSILSFEVGPGKEIILQKRAFLAAEMGVKLQVNFHKKLGAGIFGGEGFILQKVSGNGICFAEFDGYVAQYDLKPGQQLIVDSGHLAAMESTVGFDIVQVKGVKNAILGGEGLFHSVLTGPGKVWLQTMPACNVAAAIEPYIITPST